MIITHNGTILTNDGVVLNNIITSPSFTNTYSLDFDGVDDYVSLNSSIDLGINSTISVWLNLDSAYDGVLLGEDSYSFDYLLYPNSTGFYVRIGSVYKFYTNVHTYLTAGSWHHLAVVRSGDSIEVFVDGISRETQTGFGVSISTKFDTIGAKPNGTFPLEGKIDELAGWDNNTVSITDIYNGGTPTDLSLLVTPPTNWYRMGDNGSYKSPQWLIPSNENKDKVSNYSFDFDGVNDYVSLTSLVPLGLTSISFWMKSTHSSGNDSITTGLGNLSFIGTYPLVYLSGGNYRYFANQASKFDGEWHHWFLLIAGSGISDITNSRLFVDGVEISSGTTIYSSAPSLWTQTQIGRGAYGYLNCSINNFAVWEGSDESVNVPTIYNSGTPNDISSLSPTAWLKMGDNSTFLTNWTVPDQVGSNDGTSANMTIEDRVGTAPSSSNNALSFNMDLIDRVEDTPPTP